MLVYDGMSDIGLEKTVQEDVIFQDKLDKDTILFIITDGSGYVNENMDPATIACMEVSNFIRRQYEHSKKYLISNIEYLLEEALYTANRVIGTFHVVDDEKYSGFGCCMTACLIYDKHFTFAHCGNTRLHIIKNKKDEGPIIKQLTVDHTEGYEQLVLHRITEEQYLRGLTKMNLTSGLGIFSNPTIQVSTNKLSDNNIIVMTSDGIHYPLWQNVIMELILKSENTLSAVRALIDAAKIQQYPDNMSAMVIFSLPGKSPNSNEK